MGKKELNKGEKLMPQAELYNDACAIIEQARVYAYRSVNETLVKRNWLLGMRIQKEVLNDKRAEYGENVIKELADALTVQYGKGFTWRNLYNYVDFYQKHEDFFKLDTKSKENLHAVSANSEDGAENIFHAVSGKSDKDFALDILHAASAKLSTDENNIMNVLRSQSPIRLSWTHYRIILQEQNADARAWYENEAANEMWSTRTLQRNVSSQYYHRLLQSQNKELVRAEMKALTAPLQDKLEYMKNPVVAEFLGLKNNPDYSESTLEKSIIDHLIPFLMELGKGFAFVDRQKHIHTEKQDYYLDLVFYNYHLRCFVLVDLKTTKLSYQDVGQMDMYVKMYDEMVCQEGHNPTIGILLCADTDEDVAHYSVLKGNDQLYAAKYLTYMPTKEELRREIEQQKEFFRLQHKD